MRELKFRVWDKEAGEYLEGEEAKAFVLKLDGTHYVEMTFGYYNKGKDWVIEQYTGLKDKNGKEIYEGDIVKAGGRIYEVAWFEKDGGWFCFRENDSVYTPLYHLKSEVIGNIHENPWLVEEEE